MAFSASLIEITLRYLWLGQQCQTARQYTWDGAAIAAVSAEGLGEAWWNDYKDVWRACMPANLSAGQFLTVLVREIGGGLSYGEFAIPVDEQEGTRTGSIGDPLPSYAAVGVRLTVGSRATRPGQMRVSFLHEADTIRNDVQAGFLALVQDLADHYSQTSILGAPAATGTITPNVVRFGANPDTTLANQPIVGNIVNPISTSEVSRRSGHGS